jgi:hypothetical protein
VSGEAVRGGRTLEAGGARPGELAGPHPSAAGRSSHLRTKERSASVEHPACSTAPPAKRVGSSPASEAGLSQRLSVRAADPGRARFCGTSYPAPAR